MPSLQNKTHRAQEQGVRQNSRTINILMVIGTFKNILFQNLTKNMMENKTLENKTVVQKNEVQQEL